MTRAFLFLSQIVLLVFTLHSLWVLLSAAAVARWLRRDQHSGAHPSSDPPTVVVLLPALREQRLVAETLEFYATVDYPGRLLPVVITSEKEEAELRAEAQALPELFARLGPDYSDDQLTKALCAALSPNRGRNVAREALRVPAADAQGRLHAAKSALLSMPTTTEVCKTVIAELSVRPDARPCYHVHYPQTSGRKGSQLNHAVSRIEALDPEHPWVAEQTMVAVYDFDAVPHPHTFLEVAAEASDRHASRRPLPHMMQQVQLPFRFRDRFAEGVDGLLMRGYVLYWLRRGLGIEVRRLLFKQWLERRRLPRPLKGVARPLIYGIGSGLFFRLDALRTAGPFPEPHDDLAMGYRASFMGWETVPLRSFNLTEPYYTTSSLIRAWANVAYGGTQILDDLRHARARDEEGILRSWEQRLLVAREWADTLVWFLAALVVPASLVVAASAGGAWLLLGILAPVVAYPLTALIVLSFLPGLRSHLGEDSRAPWLHGRRSAALLAATFVTQPFVSAAGPWALVRRALLTRERGASLVTGKTER